MTLAWHSKTFARRVVRSSSISIYVAQLASSIPQQVLLIISLTTREQLSRIRSDQSLRKEAATYLRRISRSNGFSHGSISNSFSICSSSSWLLEFAIAEWHVALNLGVLCSRDCLVKTCVIGGAGSSSKSTKLSPKIVFQQNDCWARNCFSTCDDVD